MRSRFRHAHYLFSDSVGLLLVPITRLADGKLGPYRAGAKQSLHRKISRELRSRIVIGFVLCGRWLSIVDPVIELGRYLFHLKRTLHGLLTLLCESASRNVIIDMMRKSFTLACNFRGTD